MKCIQVTERIMILRGVSVLFEVFCMSCKEQRKVILPVNLEKRDAATELYGTASATDNHFSLVAFSHDCRNSENSLNSPVLPSATSRLALYG